MQGTSGRSPTLMSTRGMVASGHYLASAAAAGILGNGGNAIDAGVAAGLCLNVVHADMNSFSGVAPIMLYDRGMDQVVTYRGIGWFPEALASDYFQTQHGGEMPRGLTNCVVPGAPDAWLHALKNHGSMTFEQVCQSALEYAANGFPVHEFMYQNISGNPAAFSAPSTAVLFLADDGKPPAIGSRFVQKDLADTFRSLIDVERAHAGQGREVAIQAVRDYFYRGPIAETVVAFSEANGGLFALEDFAAFEADQYPPVTMEFGEFTVFGCGPWSQGPVTPLALNILKNIDLKSLGHNTPAYLHTIISALDLAFSDRHHFMGDPAHVAVPIDGLLSADYGREQAAMIDATSAFRGMAPPGNPWKFQSQETAWPNQPVDTLAVYRDVPGPDGHGGDPDVWDDDTSYVACADSFGNFFSATPSDGVGGPCPIIPGLGIVISKRGGQSWTDPRNPNAAGPRKRPRLTPNPGLIYRDGKPWAAYGTPGNDRQPQAMLQVFLNIAVFGMDLQAALDAPRVATFNFPSSSHPHDYFPGMMRCEGRIPRETVEALEALGHRVEMWPDYMPAAGAPCIAVRDPESGIFKGAADHRRQSSAIGI